MLGDQPLPEFLDTARTQEVQEVAHVGAPGQRTSVVGVYPTAGAIWVGQTSSTAVSIGLGWSYNQVIGMAAGSFRRSSRWSVVSASHEQNRAWRPATWKFKPRPGRLCGAGSTWDSHPR